MNPVIVLLADLGLARPRERDLVDAGLLDLGQPIRRDVVGHLHGVGLDELHQEIALRRLEAGGRDATGRERLERRVVPREDISRRDLVVDRRRALRVVERRHQRPRRVFHGPEDAQALLRPFDANLGGIGTEKRRRVGHRGVVGDREVQREVMAFDAPAPRTLAEGFRRW